MLALCLPAPWGDKYWNQRVVDDGQHDDEGRHTTTTTAAAHNDDGRRRRRRRRQQRTLETQLNENKKLRKTTQDEFRRLHDWNCARARKSWKRLIILMRARNFNTSAIVSWNDVYRQAASSQLESKLLAKNFTMWRSKRESSTPRQFTTSKMERSNVTTTTTHLKEKECRRECEGHRHSSLHSINARCCGTSIQWRLFVAKVALPRG